MNLHLLWDEKISHRIVNIFEAVFPNQNIYLFWTENRNQPKFISKTSNIYIIDKNESIPDIDFKSISKIIIHGLDCKKIDFCNNFLPITTPVFWILWGTELYNTLLYGRGYNLYYHAPTCSIKQAIALLIKRNFRIIGGTSRKILKFINTRDTTMVCSHEEFKIFQTYYPNHTKTIKNESNFFYYPIDEVLGKKLLNKKADGNIILVGNSCSWTNNHIYVFEILKNLGIFNRTIITPLSYGGDPSYQKLIITKGKSFFGEKYKPLIEYLPLEKYNQLMTKAEVCIYGSWRQEAFGNIIISLYLGSKVYLSEKSPLFTILKNQGLTIFPIESITTESLNTELDETAKNQNREILINKYNWERLKSVTEKIFC